MVDLLALWSLALRQKGQSSISVAIGKLGTPLVCVDKKYAASGGYMVASQAEKRIAAPFATMGSVGVIMEGINFNELAEKYGINAFVIKAGA